MWTYVVIAVGAVCLSFTFLATIQPRFLFDVISGLTFFVLGVGFVASFILGLVRWRKNDVWWILPTVLSLLFLLSLRIVTALGEAYNDSRFRASLTEYENAVRRIQVRRIPDNETFIELNKSEIQFPSNVLDIWAARCADGQVVVEFLTCARGRIHKGYLLQGV